MPWYDWTQELTYRHVLETELRSTTQKVSFEKVRKTFYAVA